MATACTFLQVTVIQICPDRMTSSDFTLACPVRSTTTAPVSTLPSGEEWTLGIERHDADVERRRVNHPGQIRNKQHSSRPLSAPRRDDGGSDCSCHQNDDRQGHSRLVKREEHG